LELVEAVGIEPTRGAVFQYILMAHSVCSEAGKLIDITPIDENTPREGLRFRRHSGTEEEFDAMKMPCSHGV
jgi:hypothetical protein